MAEHGEMDEEAGQPFLVEDESQQGPWRGWGQAEDIDDTHVSEFCSVAELLKEHPHDALRYLQCKGIARLGEFAAPDHQVFPAFQSDPLLTMGSSRRKIDCEAEWRAVLAQQGGKVQNPGWTTKVDVEAFVVTIRGAAGPDKDGLLQPLLKRWQAGRCTYTVFSIPAVQAVITWKWHAFARRILLVQLGFFLLWMLAFNAFTIAFQDEDLSLSLPQLLRTLRGRVAVAGELLALVGMAPFLLLEAGTLPAYGWGWLDAWNALDVLSYAIQIAITVMHLGRWQLESCWLTMLPALQYILLVFRLQYYTQAFRATRFAFLDTIRGVFGDIKAYLLFLLVIMWGFASAFHIVFRRDQESTEEFDTILHAFLSMFEHQYGDIELAKMYKSKSPMAATALGVAYTFIMGLVLINLLIGLVINSIDKLTENESMKMLLSQARIIDEIESTMPGWIERRHPGWFPQFVHILRINPNKLDTVAADALWSSLGEDSPPSAPGAATGLAQEHPAVEQPESPVGQGSEGSSPRPAPPTAGKGNGQEGSAGQEEVKAKGGAGAVEALQGQVAAMQQQLEKQGCLLRLLCDRLEPGAGAAEE